MGDTDCASFISGNHASQCISVAVYSKSTDGGATWSSPSRVFSAADRVAEDYPVTQPDGSTLSAPSPTGPVEDVYPAVTVTPGGTVYVSAYRGDVVAPWQSCTNYDPNGSVNCLTSGSYVNNTKLDYVVAKLAGGEQTVTTQPINTRFQFRGGFIGDYTGIASGSDGVFHALWTDTNNTQTIEWWYGHDFGGLRANQQDAVTASGS